MATTRGVVHIHSAPSALCPHVEWAVGGIFAHPVQLSWAPQPVERASLRAEYAWRGPVGTAARLASALKGWQRLRFEVTEEASAGSEGVRYAYTPALGVFQTATDRNGGTLVPEERIKRAVSEDALGGAELADALRALLGAPWDDELEVFRQATGADVRWLHQVV